MNLHVVPAKAATHNLRLAVGAQRIHKRIKTPELNLSIGGYGSPLPGDDGCGLGATFPHTPVCVMNLVLK
jgi:hypothetical protein